MADYIGARYTIKVYQNSLNPASADWESGFAYEPLTLVTYNNSSYLSKIDVPASVGSPDANPTYWAITGAYNGQILQLQNDVSALQTFDHDNFNDTFVFVQMEELLASHDGVKTIGQLMDECFNLLATWKANNPDLYFEITTILINNIYGEEKIHPVYKGSQTVNILFPEGYLVSGGSLFITSGTMQASGSTCDEYVNGTVSDITNTIATNDVYIRMKVYAKITA